MILFILMRHFCRFSNTVFAFLSNLQWLAFLKCHSLARNFGLEKWRLNVLLLLENLCLFLIFHNVNLKAKVSFKRTSHKTQTCQHIEAHLTADLSSLHFQRGVTFIYLFSIFSSSLFGSPFRRRFKGIWRRSLLFSKKISPSIWPRVAFCRAQLVNLSSKFTTLGLYLVTI